MAALDFHRSFIPKHTTQGVLFSARAAGRGKGSASETAFPRLSRDPSGGAPHSSPEGVNACLGNTSSDDHDGNTRARRASTVPHRFRKDEQQYKKKLPLLKPRRVCCVITHMLAIGRLWNRKKNNPVLTYYLFASGNEIGLKMLISFNWSLQLFCTLWFI